MAISVFPQPSSSSGATATDFTVNVGSSGSTNVTLSTTFPAGSYICTSSLSDTTLDIYFLSSDGAIVGYANSTTATTTITASDSFNRVVLYGGANNDTLEFQFKYVFAPSAVTTNFGAPARLISRSVATLPNLNDTVVLTGENFASDVVVKFIGTDLVERAPKTVVRDSSTQLTVTRPDDFPTTINPYSIKVTNPGITNLPTTTNQHIIANTISSGASPVWVTGSQLSTAYYNTAFSQQLSATDSDGGSSITYSIISGSFPTGISMNSSGLISGTSTSTSGGGKVLTIRATDSGGNYLDLNTVLPYALATGGTIQTQGSTLFHTFSSNGTYTQLVTAPVSYITVGGGGRGASSMGGSGAGGGGGGGGLRDATSKSMSPQAYAIVIGGAQTASTFDGLTAGGGGNTGGSTGGTSGSPQSRSGAGSGGGGGGAGAAATTSEGGLGVVFPSIQRGGVYSASYQYGVGGNGGSWVSSGGGLTGPGSSPSPSGGPYLNEAVGGPGEANSGGGGGMSGGSQAGNGGSGVVIIKY
jgi:hypothetical protein